jgi:hypothetical protein
VNFEKECGKFTVNAEKQLEKFWKQIVRKKHVGKSEKELEKFTGKKGKYVGK